MYVYDIEEEDTLSDDWAISSTNITITGLEPNYPFLGLCSVYIHYHIFYRECVCDINIKQINQ